MLGVELLPGIASPVDVLYLYVSGPPAAGPGAPHTATTLPAAFLVHPAFISGGGKLGRRAAAAAVRICYRGLELLDASGAPPNTHGPHRALLVCGLHGRRRLLLRPRGLAC